MIVGIATVAIGFFLAPGVRAQSAAAQQTPSGDPIGPMMDAVHMRTTPPEPSDFVRRTRKPVGDLDFVPIAGRRNEPDRRAMTPDEIHAKEAELDGVRARHDAMAKRRAPTGPFKSAAGDPKKVVNAKPAKCLITCAINTTVVTSVSGVAPTSGVAP